MVIAKREDLTKESFFKILRRKRFFSGKSHIITYLIFLVGRAGERGWGGAGRLFEAGRLTTLFAFRMGVNSSLGAYSNNYGNS